MFYLDLIKVTKNSTIFTFYQINLMLSLIEVHYFFKWFFKIAIQFFLSCVRKLFESYCENKLEI